MDLKSGVERMTGSGKKLISDCRLALFDKLWEVLRYDPEDGELYWKVTKGAKREGKRTGTLAHNGYKVVKVFSVTYSAHRLAWFLYYGTWPVGVIDHIDHDRSNNRINNLRNISYGENQLHRRAVKLPVSGRPGIRLNPNGSYTAFALGSRTRVSLGTRWSLKEAIRLQENHASKAE